jgi:branched-chain amino acid transport system permease protein
VTLVAIPEIVHTVVDRVGASPEVADNLPALIVSALLIVTVIFVPNGPVEQMRSKKKVQSL